MFEANLIPYKTVNIPNDKNIIVFAPHPDDEVFGCGGAIALHAQNDASVAVVLITSDDEIRLQESLKAAKILGYSELIAWQKPDRGIVYNESLIEQIVQLITSVNATLVYAPSFWENHPDHRAVALAVFEAARRMKNVSLAQYEVGAPLRPNMIIDITQVSNQKKLAIDSFVSQIKLRNYAEYISALNIYRTYSLPTCVKSAEAFEYYPPQALNFDCAPFFASEFTRQYKNGILDLSPKKKLVSVLIRSTNRKYLEAAIASVIIQTYPYIEIIVVNASGKVHRNFNEFAGRYEIKLVDTQAQLSRSKAANLALENASGEFAIFLDDDDWIDAGHIEKLVCALENENEALLAYTDTSVINELREEIGRFEHVFSCEQIYIDNFIPIHSVLFKMRAFKKLGCKFDVNLDVYEDWDFWIQLANFGSFKHAKGISAFYRMEFGGSSSVHKNDAKNISRLKVLKKWIKNLDDDKLLFFANEALRARDLNNLKLENKTINENLNNLKLENKTINENLNNLKLENKTIKTKLLALENEIANILQTASWRYTHYLRVAKHCVKSLFIGNYKEHGDAVILSFIKVIINKIINKLQYFKNEILRKLEKGSKFNGEILYESAFTKKDGKRICLFSHFDKDNLIDPYVIYYLQNLKTSGCDIIFISTANLNNEAIDAISDLCSKIIVKENIGYDFGAWKTAIELCLDDILKYNQLILCNDSVYAPLFNLEEIFNYMEKENYDAWGITESYDIKYHIQSYFIVFEKNAFTHKEFLNFWQNFLVFKYKRNIIENYEIGISNLMRKLGFNIGAYCRLPSLLPQKTNPTHSLWQELIEQNKCPIIKVELLRDNPLNIDVSTFENIIIKYTNYPINLINNHLRRINLRKY